MITKFKKLKFPSNFLLVSEANCTSVQITESSIPIKQCPTPACSTRRSLAVYQLTPPPPRFEDTNLKL